jgi:hypothetical protein
MRVDEGASDDRALHQLAVERRVSLFIYYIIVACFGHADHQMTDAAHNQDA